MKKTIALILTLIMVLAIVPAFSVFAEDTQLKITPLFGGWENWVNSPNNPNKDKATDEEKKPGVTELLVGVNDKDGKPFVKDTPAYNAVTNTATQWTITLTWNDGTVKTKTITLAPGTVQYEYSLVRFETAFATGDNQFIPCKNQKYTVKLTTTVDGVTYTGTSADYAFECPMCPVVNGAIDESYTYAKPAAKYPYDVKFVKYFTEEDENNKGFFPSDFENWAPDDKTDKKLFLVIQVEKAGLYDSKDIVDKETKVEYTIGGKVYKTTLDSTYNFEKTVLIRVPADGLFTPEAGKTYSVGLKLFNKDNTLMYQGTIDNIYGANVPYVAPVVTGDVAVYATVALVIALASMAVVFKKVRV